MSRAANAQNAIPLGRCQITAMTEPITRHQDSERRGRVTTTPADTSAQRPVY